MGALILAGQDLIAGTGPGQLNERYGFADATPTTVTGTSFVSLSTPYVIPAGEAGYAGASYELSCGGVATWGSTAQQLFFQMNLGGGFGSSATVPAATFAANATVAFALRMTLTCSDGVSAWWGTLEGMVGNYPVPSANSGAHLAAVSGALTAVIQAHQGSVTGAPSITNYRTNWKKVA